MLLIHPIEEEITPEVVQKFIDLHKAEVPRYRRLKNLYESNAPILSQDAKAEHKPDHRLVNNFARYIVSVFNGYFIGIPIKVAHDDKSVNEKVDTFLSINDMDDNLAELAKITSIYGHGFEYLWQDEDSLTNCIYNTPLDMFIVYDDTIAQRPLFAVRYQTTDDGIKGQLFTATEEITISESKDGLILSNNKPHYYGGVPIIEYIENEERQSIFEPVETLINKYDLTISEKMNDVSYFSDAYLLLLGMELDEQTLQNIRDNRIINMFGKNEDVKNLIAKFLDKPNADGTQENLLDRLERNIHKKSMVPDINDENFGSLSGVALEFKLQNMKNLASMKERKFVSGMNRRFKMVFNLPTNIEASKKDEWRNLSYKFTRNMPRNISDEANTASTLQGIVSKEKQLSVLSIVDNVQDEIQRIEAEKNNAGYKSDSNGDFVVGDQ